MPFSKNILRNRIFCMCQDGWTSLMIASQNGHVEVVDKLLHHGATVDLQSKVMMSALCLYHTYQ